MRALLVGTGNLSVSHWAVPPCSGLTPGTPCLPVWDGSSGTATLTGLSCVCLQPPERRGAGSRVLLAAGGAGGGGDGAGGLHPVPPAGQEQMRATPHSVPVTPAPHPQRRPEGPRLKLAPRRKFSFAPSLDCRTSEARAASTSRIHPWHRAASAWPPGPRGHRAGSSARRALPHQQLEDHPHLYSVQFF